MMIVNPGEQNGSEYDVKWSILIREIPQPGKIELKGTKNILDFSGSMRSIPRNDSMMRLFG